MSDKNKKPTVPTPSEEQARADGADQEDAMLKAKAEAEAAAAASAAQGLRNVDAEREDLRKRAAEDPNNPTNL